MSLQYHPLHFIDPQIEHVGIERFELVPVPNKSFDGLGAVRRVSVSASKYNGDEREEQNRRPKSTRYSRTIRYIIIIRVRYGERK